MKIRKAFFAALCIAALGLASCFSSWNGEPGEGTISINLGNNLTQRGITEVTDEIKAAMEYAITLTSAAGETVEQKLEQGVSKVTIAVLPGVWDVEVTAFLDGKPFTEGFAEAVTVRAGEHISVSITMVLYTVSFNNDETLVESQKVGKGGTITRPATPTLDGHTFAGWYSDKELTTIYNFSMLVTSDITLYAKWNEVPLGSFVVTFNSGGGSGIADQVVKSGEKAGQPDNPTLDGSIFDGWYSDEELAVEYDFDTPITANITLYAKWKEVPLGSFVVTFNSNGGSHIDGKIVKSDDTAARPDDPTREGYNFAGWYRNEELTVEYNFETPVTANITLYAKWEKKRGHVTITVTLGSSGLEKPEVVLKNGNDVISNITISRLTEATYTITLVNFNAFTNIEWEVPGIGVGGPVSGSGNSFTLDAADFNYNAVGKHVLYLTFKWNGNPYLVETPFTVVD
jgi:uncharacterized repeat protein (TIGR02543 family)